MSWSNDQNSDESNGLIEGTEPIWNKIIVCPIIPGDFGRWFIELADWLKLKSRTIWEFPTSFKEFRDKHFEFLYQGLGIVLLHQTSIIKMIFRMTRSHWLIQRNVLSFVNILRLGGIEWWTIGNAIGIMKILFSLSRIHTTSMVMNLYWNEIKHDIWFIQTKTRVRYSGLSIWVHWLFHDSGNDTWLTELTIFTGEPYPHWRKSIKYINMNLSVIDECILTWMWNCFCVISKVIVCNMSWFSLPMRISFRFMFRFQLGLINAGTFHVLQAISNQQSTINNQQSECYRWTKCQSMTMSNCSHWKTNCHWFWHSEPFISR
jgi:hypothetical protein